MATENDTTTPNYSATPWALGFADDRVAFVNADVVTVCRCDLGGDEGERLADPRANAAFIVKAVNCHDHLLDALRVAAEALDNYSDVNDGDGGRPVANAAMSAMQAVEAAIEKAEGRTL